MRNETDGAKLVAGAVLGFDGERVMVGGKSYILMPPTIRKLLGCAYYLSDLGKAETIMAMVLDAGRIEDSCKALSWLICGSEKLVEELKDGTIEEVATGIDTAIKLCGTMGFIMLSLLGKNVPKMIANQRS